MKNVKKMIQAGLKKFTVITILGVFLMTSLIPVSAATKVSKIKWSAYRKTMYVGNAQRFAVKITPAKASKAKLGWKTSNKKIAKVSAKGVVTPVKAGKATITCYVKSQKSKKVTCKVTVKKQKVTAITFAKASVAVQKGKKVSNPAIVTPTYAANKKVTYKSSSTSVATVSTSGVVTGKKGRNSYDHSNSSRWIKEEKQLQSDCCSTDHKKQCQVYRTPRIKCRSTREYDQSL